MNPLSPFTYYRRHRRAALLMVSLVALVTLGVSVMVGVLDSIADHFYATTLGSMTHFSLVQPDDGLSLDPTIASQLRAHPDIAQVIPENGASMVLFVPTLGLRTLIKVLGIPTSDIQVLLDACEVRLKEGRLPQARAGEIALSEEIARALNLHIGDRVDRTVDDTYYMHILAPMEVVGILENTPSLSEGSSSPKTDAPRQSPYLAIVSYDYLESHELYAPRQSGLLVIPKEGRKAAMDTFLGSSIASSRTQVTTYEQARTGLAFLRRTFYLGFAIVDCLVAIVVALVIATINRIALTQRLSELGLLHAIGHHKQRLTRRLTLETAAVAGTGWIAGLALSWLAFAWLRTNLYEPRGVMFDLGNPTPIWFAIPIPLTVIGLAAFSILRTFARLDPVAIVERGKLSAEGAEGKKQKAKRSSAKSLSFWTFYKRHRRRGVMLIAATTLMILGVAFPAFFLSPLVEMQKVFFLNHRRYATEVQPLVGRTIDPGTVTQIRAHPAAKHVIPATPLQLAADMPFMQAFIFGVSEDDLAVLTGALKLQLAEGHLPRARSSEVVLTETMAKNRGLSVGDTFGKPVDSRDMFIPVEMRVVGILSVGEDNMALGFASSEYLETHEDFPALPTYLFVVPTAGRKPELDKWLESEVDSTRTQVATYDGTLRNLQQIMGGFYLLLATVEAVIAIVSALALAALNYIFFSQRRDEFGTLHALGRNRSWLVLRAVRETSSTVAAAWLIGAATCIAGLVAAQAGIYTPLGLNVGFSNAIPWLFTFPIPLAVVGASGGTIAWMLSRLDPVAVIERR